MITTANYWPVLHVSLNIFSAALFDFQQFILSKLLLVSRFTFINAGADSLVFSDELLSEWALQKHPWQDIDGAQLSEELQD